MAGSRRDPAEAAHVGPRQHGGGGQGGARRRHGAEEGQRALLRAQDHAAHLRAVRPLGRGRRQQVAEAPEILAQELRDYARCCGIKAFS